MNSFVMITGACGVLGSLFAHECGRRGYNLYLVDISEEGSTFAASLSHEYQVEVRYQACNLIFSEARDKLQRILQEEQIRFWGLINVAGLEYEGAFLNRTRQQIQSIIRVNIEGALDLIHIILTMRSHSQRFVLINVSSLAGFFPMPYKATYAATKGFLRNFSRALGEEIQDFGSVTTLCPAGLPTTQERIQRIERQGWWGKITTCDPRIVVKRTLDYALRGKAIYIPGTINTVLVYLASILPSNIVLKIIATRWR